MSRRLRTILLVILLATGLCAWSLVRWSGPRWTGPVAPAPAAPAAPAWSSKAPAPPRQDGLPAARQPQLHRVSRMPADDPHTAAYDLPLEIQCQSPDVPPEIQPPSPPIR